MANRSSKAQDASSQHNVLPNQESGAQWLDPQVGEAAGVTSSGRDLVLTLADGSTLRLEGALDQAALLDQLEAQLNPDLRAQLEALLQADGAPVVLAQAGPVQPAALVVTEVRAETAVGRIQEASGTVSVLRAG